MMSRWVTLCRSDELPDGEREVFGVDDRWIAVFRVSGKLYAIEDICTHDGNTLAFDRDDRPSILNGTEIECPRHGGRFDIRDGKATRSPAEIDVPRYDARDRDGQIQLLLPA